MLCRRVAVLYKRATISHKQIILPSAMLHNLCLFLLLLNAGWILVAKADDDTGSGDEAGPLVETLNGPVRGFNFKLPVIQRYKTDIENAHIFLGIPYAKPPLKELRLEASFIITVICLLFVIFQKPKPVGNWSETLDATEFPLGEFLCNFFSRKTVFF